MARFPRTEAEIVTLAQAMVSGLTGAEGLPNVNYPSPPVAPAELTALISAYTTAKNAAIVAQARLLEAPKQGEGWMFLDWKAPIDGGASAAYKVMRRERPAGSWEDAATAVITEATLVEQPRGKELEYRIIAVNKAGDGESSNTAMVVL